MTPLRFCFRDSIPKHRTKKRDIRARPADRTILSDGDLSGIRDSGGLTFYCSTPRLLVTLFLLGGCGGSRSEAIGSEFLFSDDGPMSRYFD